MNLGKGVQSQRRFCRQTSMPWILIQAAIGSQCKLIKIGVTSIYLGSLKTNLAAAFWINCKAPPCYVCVPACSKLCFIWMNKDYIFGNLLRFRISSLQHSRHTWQNTGTNRKWEAPFPPCLFSAFWKFFCFPCLFLPAAMEMAAARFLALARKDLPFYKYAGEFYGLAAATAWDDATLNSLFWLGTNYHRPVDLPDTTGLSWKEGVFRCLGSVRARARTSPPSSPPAVPQSSPPSAAKSSPPSAAPTSPPAVQFTPNWKRGKRRKRLLAALILASKSVPAPELAPVSAPAPELAPVAVPAPELAPVSAPAPELAPVSAPAPEHHPVPVLSPGRAPDSPLSPGRATDPPLSPGWAPVPEFSPERAAIPTEGLGACNFPQRFLCVCVGGGYRAPVVEAGARAEATATKTAPPWPPELPALPWPPESPDPSWLPESPDPSWTPESPDPPWPPESPDPPWPP